MKRTVIIMILLIAAMLIVFTVGAIAQTPIKQDSNGNYHAVAYKLYKDTAKVFTGKTYTDTKGVIYPVYKTSTGKLYIIRISKNTGKEYKQYLKV